VVLSVSRPLGHIIPLIALAVEVLPTVGPERSHNQIALWSLFLSTLSRLAGAGRRRGTFRNHMRHEGGALRISWRDCANVLS
jgi:hypothetical protein